jgi:hypothetical protein
MRCGAYPSGAKTLVRQVCKLLNGMKRIGQSEVWRNQVLLEPGLSLLTIASHGKELSVNALAGMEPDHGEAAS